MDAELIVIIVAVALSIISGVSKSKKKKAQTGHQHENTGQEDDPWASIRKYIEDAQNGGDDTEEEIPSYESRAEVTPAGSINRKVEVVHKEDPYVSGLNEYMLKKQHKSDRKGREQKKKIPAQVTPPAPSNVYDTTTEDILEDFDLRKAVIYSEILKPKFDEY